MAGLVEARIPGEDQAVIASPKTPFPVYFPTLMKKGSRYWDGFGTDAPRTYRIRDEDKKLHRAYRMVVEAPGLGEYYGVQGIGWKDAPILREPVRGADGARAASSLLYRDGSRLRMVAWKTDKAAYWVSNTLLRSLTQRSRCSPSRAR